MELIKHSDIKTIEDYKEYKRQKARLWYQQNKEKKKEYQLKRYYSETNKKEII